jgi:MFS family permease
VSGEEERCYSSFMRLVSSYWLRTICSALLAISLSACGTLGNTWDASAVPPPPRPQRTLAVSDLGIAATATGLSSALLLGVGGAAWDQYPRQDNWVAGWFVSGLGIAHFTAGAALGLVSVGFTIASTRPKRESRVTARR